MSHTHTQSRTRGDRRTFHLFVFGFQITDRPLRSRSRMLRHSRCHMLSFVSDAVLPATLCRHWEGGGGQVEKNREADCTFTWSATPEHARGESARRPVWRSNSWFGERVSWERRAGYLLSVRGQASAPTLGLWRCSVSVARSSGTRCGDVTAPGLRVQPGARSFEFRGTITSWKPHINTLHEEVGRQTAWIVRLCVPFAWTEKSWLHFIPKNVYRAAGRALGLFCFRYKAQLSKKPSSFLSPTHFFFFFFFGSRTFQSGKWVFESVGTYPHTTMVRAM